MFLKGCIKFLESYYLILVTRHQQIGSVCNHAIYSIDESQFLTVPHATVQSEVAHSKTELRYFVHLLLVRGYVFVVAREQSYLSFVAFW